MALDETARGKWEVAKGKITGDKTTEMKGRARQEVAQAKKKFNRLSGNHEQTF